MISCNVRGLKKRKHVDFRLDSEHASAEDREALKQLVLKMAKKVGIDPATVEYGCSIEARTPSRGAEELRRVLKEMGQRR